MKKYTALFVAMLAWNACSKVEEKISQTVEETTTRVKENAQNKLKETFNKSLSGTLNSLTGAEDAQFSEVFSSADPAMITEFSGSKFSFHNGTPVYVFKYKAEKEVLLPFLEAQETNDESESDKTATKVDGTYILEKLSFLEKFLPANTLNNAFLKELKNDKNIEYYRLKRSPKSSTFIYNPKSKQVFHFVEVTQQQ